MLPPDWTIAHVPEPAWSSDTGIDAVYEIEAAENARGRIHIAIKRHLEPRDLPRVLRVMSAYEERLPGETLRRSGRVIVASYISPRVRELLAAEHTGWFDSAGNLRLQLPQPLIFIDRHGADRNPYPAPDRPLRSLRGRAAARIVRALMDGQGYRGVRELASDAGVSAATSSRVLDLLARESLVERDPGGAITATRKRSLMRRWVEDYGVTLSNHAVPVLAARGVDRVLHDLRDYPGRYSLTMGAALQAYLPPERAAVAPLALLALYVDNAVTAQRDLGLRATQRGANVLLIEPFDDVVHQNATARDRLRYVSPAQAIADLLTGPGRSAEEAAQLIELLATTDPEWNR